MHSITYHCGIPQIGGTRIPVHAILDLLASGRSWDDILAAYPALQRDDVREALVYASHLARQRALKLKTPQRGVCGECEREDELQFARLCTEEDVELLCSPCGNLAGL